MVGQCKSGEIDAVKGLVDLMAQVSTMVLDNDNCVIATGSSFLGSAIHVTDSEIVKALGNHQTTMHSLKSNKVSSFVGGVEIFTLVDRQ